MQRRLILKTICKSLFLLGLSQSKVFSALKEIIKTEEEWKKS